MSLYAQYLKERTEDEIYEDDHAFATYRLLNDGRSIYIVDIFVLPDYRNQGIAARIANSISAIGRARGCKELLGSVVPKAKGCTESLKVLIAYGMTLDSSTDNLIVFRKDL